MTRKAYDRLMKSLVYIATSFTAIILLAIIAFTVSNGTALLSWKLVSGDYYAETYSVETEETVEYCNCEYDETIGDDSYYSSKWGVMFSDVEDNEGKGVVEITYIDENSPFNKVNDISDGFERSVDEGAFINNYFITDNGNAYVKNGAESMLNVLDGADTFRAFGVTKEGGGIRGSIISTMYLIFFTLIIAVPFGVLTAIYMNEYARKNKFMNILGTMIDTLTGVPSIIFGLMGAAIFIPMVNNISGTEGNFGSIMAGALTMSVILLPVIVKTTKEALNHVPKAMRSASLALGANTTQTTFKIVLRNSIPGIVSGVILGIGRIVGESAALIFAMGTLINDNPGLFDRSTSLAVHIWTVMAGEVPNFELASAIALIILVVVLTLNILVKQIAKRFDRMKG